MYLYCSKCKSQHLASERCPRCSSRLLTPGEIVEVLPQKAAKTPGNIMPTQFQVLFVSVLIALGTALGFSEMLDGLRATISMDAESLSYAIALLISRTLSIAVGALIAGAGRGNGYGLGLLVGGIASTIWLGLDMMLQPSLNFAALSLICCPLVGMMFGALGTRVWPKDIVLPKPQHQLQSSLLKVGDKPESEKNERPTNWLRIILACSLILFVPFLATKARQTIGKMPASVMNNLNDPAVLPRTECQLATLLLLFAGMIAGASSHTGIRHGAYAGFIGTTLMLGFSLALPENSERLFTYVAKQFGFVGNSAEGMLCVSLATFSVVLISAWLGSQLFPPIVKQRRRGR